MSVQEPNLPHWNEGDVIGATDLNALSDSIRDLTRYYQGSAKEKGQTAPNGPPRLPNFTVADVFVAITRSGACGTTGGDYTDARYYLDRGVGKDTLGATDQFAAQVDQLPGAQACITGTNLAEIGGSGHNVPAGTTVLCFRLYNRSANTPTPLYVFYANANCSDASPVVLTSGGLAPDTNFWDSVDDTNGVSVQVVTDVVWDATHMLLKKNYRTFLYDNCGNLSRISAETAATVDTATTC